jgi:predicted GIY-YIG superfamily endonuclease
MPLFACILARQPAKRHALRRLQRLVWCETHESRESAWTRERRMKTWREAWKLERIERFNPTWRDLFEDFSEQKAWVPAFAGKNGRG